jgi:protein TonB
VVYQPAPEYPRDLKRKNIQGTVYVIFVVNRDGRVTRPKVQKSSHPDFERPALRAVKRWRFEPGKKAGQPVPFKMRVPISFVNT